MKDDLALNKWTFEDLDWAVRVIKNSIQWVDGHDFSTMRIGILDQEVVVMAATMRDFSNYFLALSLPTTCYADQFVQDTTQLLKLTEEEVMMFDWITDWCHEGGFHNGRQIYMFCRERSLRQWISAFKVADILGMPLLQKYVADAIFWKMTEEMEILSADIINYLYSHQPYKALDGFEFLENYFTKKFAHQVDYIPDSDLSLFAPSFLARVLCYREKVYSEEPDETNGDTEPETSNGSGSPQKQQTALPLAQSNSSNENGWVESIIDGDDDEGFQQTMTYLIPHHDAFTPPLNENGIVGEIGSAESSLEKMTAPLDQQDHSAEPPPMNGGNGTPNVITNRAISSNKHTSKEDAQSEDTPESVQKNNPQQEMTIPLGRPKHESNLSKKISFFQRVALLSTSKSSTMNAD